MATAQLITAGQFWRRVWCRARHSVGINLDLCSDSEMLTDRGELTKSGIFFTHIYQPDCSSETEEGSIVRFVCFVLEGKCTSLYECNDTESGVQEEREPESQVSAEFSDSPECKLKHTLCMSLLSAVVK